MKQRLSNNARRKLYGVEYKNGVVACLILPVFKNL